MPLRLSEVILAYFGYLMQRARSTWLNTIALKVILSEWQVRRPSWIYTHLDLALSARIARELRTFCLLP